MTTFVAGLSFQTAPVNVREQLAVSPAKLRCTSCRLKLNGGLNEVVVLSTCNRMEIYGVTQQRGIDSLLKCITRGNVELASHLFVHEGEDAARHLFSVAGGLDSMVIGETEITGQVKHAYQTAQQAGLTGRVTNCLFQKALQTAKEIRTCTQIQRGATSVRSVAVQLAEKIFGNQFSEKTVMIIGAGKMGEACIKHLAKKGARSIIVSNRSLERAQLLAGEFGGRAVRLDNIKAELVNADIVVSSTGSPQTILRRADVEEVMQTRRNRPLFFIDIAVPRDIDAEVALLENVYLYDIDDLQEIVRENARLREQELAQCENIISEKISEVFTKLNRSQTHEPRREKESGLGFAGFAPSPV